MVVQKSASATAMTRFAGVMKQEKTSGGQMMLKLLTGFWYNTGE